MWEGREVGGGEDVWLFENSCINTFTSSSFLQVTQMIQGESALCIFSSAALVLYETTNLQIFSQVHSIRNDS